MVRKKETKNILDMVPVRTYDWEDDETVLVKVPRFRGKVGQKFIDLVKKEQTYDVKFDKYGSYVWRMCDGKTTVRAIGLALKEKYGDEVEPVFERVGEMFNIMEANKLIKYKKNKNN